MQFLSLQSLARRTLPRALSLLAASAFTIQAQPFGEALIQRSNIDAFTGFITIANAPFTTAATLTSFSVLGGVTTGIPSSNVGRSITPLLVSIPTGGTFSILGVGTSRTVASGMNTWDFGLVSGSASVGANVYFAWLSLGAGAVMYDIGGAPSMSFTGTQSVTAVPAVGASFGVFTSENREYSIQWTTQSAAPPTPGVVPEPSTYAMLVTGLAGLALVSRRRRAAASRFGGI